MSRHPTTTPIPSQLNAQFQSVFGCAPTHGASAPGRLEVLGNHTDYNAGLTLSCAVGFRCYAAIATIQRPTIELASTAFDEPPVVFSLDQIEPVAGHWTHYILGVIDAMRRRGHVVPGFSLLIDSAVPRSAGVSSSAALEMAGLAALLSLMGIALPDIEQARMGQESESQAVGAQTGMLDQLSSLLGRRDHLLLTDFKSLAFEHLGVPEGWCFVAVDSGVKHDLTAEYNERRASCIAAGEALGVQSLREVDQQSLSDGRSKMDVDAYGCAMHVVGENARVAQVQQALAQGDVTSLGALMFESHQSSRTHFRNSCIELDELVAFAANDPRCIGARLSGGGFGGITIHLVQQSDAKAYLADLLGAYPLAHGKPRWGAVCEIDDGVSTLDLTQRPC